MGSSRSLRQIEIGSYLGPVRRYRGRTGRIRAEADDDDYDCDEEGEEEDDGDGGGGGDFREERR